jgi:hypothetical protein
MISLVIILPLVLRKCHSIRLRIISTSKDAIDTILVQNIRVEKLAEPRLAMTQRIRIRCIACRSTDVGIVRLGLGECLDAHVRVVGSGRLDGRVAKVNGAAIISEYHWWLVVNVGASDKDVKLGLVLPEVSGFAGSHHGAKEGALDAGDRRRSWAVDVVSIQGRIALEVWHPSDENYRFMVRKYLQILKEIQPAMESHLTEHTLGS